MLRPFRLAVSTCCPVVPVNTDKPPVRLQGGIRVGDRLQVFRIWPVETTGHRRDDRRIVDGAKRAPTSWTEIAARKIR